MRFTPITQLVSGCRSFLKLNTSIFGCITHNKIGHTGSVNFTERKKREIRSAGTTSSPTPILRWGRQRRGVEKEEMLSVLLWLMSSYIWICISLLVSKCTIIEIVGAASLICFLFFVVMNFYLSFNIVLLETDRWPLNNSDFIPRWNFTNNFLLAIKSLLSLVKKSHYFFLLRYFPRLLNTLLPI